MSQTPQSLKLPALNPDAVLPRTSSLYPEPFKSVVAGRSKQALGNAVGLKNFGVNRVTLAPGAASALRHWHTKQDEFIYVLAGEITLITDAGEQVLSAGMAVGFPAGNPDGHHLVNKSSADAMYLEVGDRLPGDEAAYPDHDLAVHQAAQWQFTKKNGSPY